MIALAWAFVGFAALALTAIATLAVLNHRSKNEQLACRDLLDAERERNRVLENDLRLETSAHAVTRDELRKERDLRASAESQRNDAYREARDHVIERIKKAGVADAQRIISDLLSAPLGVPQAVPEGRATAPGPDRLLDPFAVRTPSDP